MPIDPVVFPTLDFSPILYATPFSSTPVGLKTLVLFRRSSFEVLGGHLSSVPDCLGEISAKRRQIFPFWFNFVHGRERITGIFAIFCLFQPTVFFFQFIVDAFQLEQLLLFVGGHNLVDNL